MSGQIPDKLSSQLMLGRENTWRFIHKLCENRGKRDRFFSDKRSMYECM